MLELGCGDGNQLSYFKVPNYIGIDVSQTIITKNKEKFKNDTTKQFFWLNDYLANSPKKAPLAISLDVIYHLVDDNVFEAYMNNLFAYSQKFVIIYSSNKDEYHAEHVKHRKFSNWIESNMQEWKLLQHIPNKYPFDIKNPNHTSFADFYIYEKID